MPLWSISTGGRRKKWKWAEGETVLWCRPTCSLSWLHGDVLELERLFRVAWVGINWPSLYTLASIGWYTPPEGTWWPWASQIFLKELIAEGCLQTTQHSWEKSFLECGSWKYIMVDVLWLCSLLGYSLLLISKVFMTQKCKESLNYWENSLCLYLNIFYLEKSKLI